MSKIVKVTRATQKPPIESVTIELTGEEAEALWLVTQFIGGRPDGTRGLFSDRRGSLSGKLADVLGDQLPSTNDIITGNLQFTD